MQFFKYHALGNDYLVLKPREDFLPLPETIRKICHRHFGLGSDGILYGPLPAQKAPFALRIFNPDGSEAEKSGNGLRIFARYLFDQKKVGHQPFEVETIGGTVRCAVLPDASTIQVEMGMVSFDARDIPLPTLSGEVLNQTLTLDEDPIVFNAATIGNPHCVVHRDVVTAEETRRLGPRLETHPVFPNRTNVQFLQVIDRRTIKIEIWERGAGYTLASGSSSSAAAAVAHRLGLCDAQITVVMPGGEIGIEIGPRFQITMTGPATPVGTYTAAPELFSQVLPSQC
ncbi:MAG: diaminopimelate epimerase [Puniceicoccaceae bacterium]